MLTLMSYGIAVGPPGDFAARFDVRDLPNPHQVPELRPLTGLDCRVQQFLRDDPKVIAMVAQIVGVANQISNRMGGTVAV